jgi:predicted Zn-dependent protease
VAPVSPPPLEGEPAAEAADAAGEVEIAEIDGAGAAVGESEDLSHIKDPAVRFRALMHRGAVQLKRGKPESALEAFRAATELKPDAAPAQLGQASSLLALGRSSDAESQVNQVLEKKPRNAEAFLLLGDILRVRGEADQARWAYDRCIKLGPDTRFARAARKALSAM